ncbi:uncharacterized protein LOC143295136 [Babylonia areolata]|uniref:uncharacterized protein LOC143295136 n=1 Tax=Babylonia areolata TaxID=304850 RepID=UPI003FD457B4
MSGGDVWAYHPPLSLWRLVEQNVSPEQQDEIRSMLGTSLIETTLDLHNEIDMLLEIWRDYQDETESETPKVHTLAEPPHIRERLIHEICFLAEGVREKSLRKGMNPSDLFSGHNSNILEYAEEAKRSGTSLGQRRPVSALSLDGRHTPLSPSELATSRSLLSETIHDDVSSTADKLNYMHFDQVCSQLRDTLKREAEQLESDVLFLQGCLDQAADTRSQAATPSLSREPTLTELREERSLLEKELLSAQHLPTAPTVSKPSFLAKPSTPAGKVPALTPVKTRLRPAAGIDRNPNKTKAAAPLKASHSLHPAPSADHQGFAASPDSYTRVSPDSYSSPATLGSHRASGRQTCDVNFLDTPPNPTTTTTTTTHPRSDADSGSGSAPGEGSVAVRRHEGSGTGTGRRRSLSPARVTVVPVGSVGVNVGVGGGRPFLPAPPPSAEKPQLPRPSSAERFRKMVMHSRETT